MDWVFVFHWISSLLEDDVIAVADNNETILYELPNRKKQIEESIPDDNGWGWYIDIH